jgi:hypothetical protein
MAIVEHGRSVANPSTSGATATSMMTVGVPTPFTSPARRCVITAPRKYRTTPIAAAMPNGR